MFIFLFTTPYLVQSLIIIKKVECLTQFGSCPENINEEFNVLGRRNLRVTKKYLNQIFENNILVDNYLLQYKIPSTLKVELVLKKPYFAIKNTNPLVDSKNKYQILDRDGTVLEFTGESNLPTLSKNAFSSKLGEKISGVDLFALQIIMKVSRLYTIEQGTLENNSLNIFLKDGLLVRFPLEGDVDLLAGSLRLVFSRLNDGSQGIKMSDIKEIDLRFKDVILR